MPSTVTHGYFANEVFNKMNKTLQKEMKPYLENLKTFAQGPDILYFYNLFSMRKGKNIRDFGHYMHHNKTKDFFVAMIKYIKENHLENNYEVKATLYGLLMHYVLDSTVHPYVFYHTGSFRKKEPNTHKYNSLHSKMESYLDAYIMWHYNQINPKDFSVTKFCFNITKFSNINLKMLDNVFIEVFKKNNMGSIYFKSMKQMKIYYKFLRHDRMGFKKTAYKTIDKFTPKSFIKLTPVSYNQNPNQLKFYLNEERNTWFHPLDINETYEFSFFDLYNQAADNVLEIINTLEKYFSKKISYKSVDKIIPNIDYATGKDINVKKRMQYFRI